ncbi:MAG: aldo/keto reductase [Desulfobacterales bacterium]|nr:aldo/keto reductase [Desulfobacterales bacterium]
MAENNNYISRRSFFKIAGAVGVGSLLSPPESYPEAQATTGSKDSLLHVVPTKPFGRANVRVPILCLGSAFGRSSNLLLKQAINMGVRFWDTAAVYAGGNSERAIGKYFKKFPEDREKIFLLTKSYSLSSAKWSTDLDKSLERMNTDYIDLFLSHAVSYADDLVPPLVNSELWAEKRKSEGKIRFFGFSTHKNMAENLMIASQYSWIDGIMFTYNFRIMNEEKMHAAVDACAKAGIGLIAMKTQASGYMGYTDKITPNEQEQVLFDQLAKEGFTFEQAKLKAVWDDPRIASITSGITNMSLLQENVAAALNSKKLSSRSKQLLNHYAHRTASNYCAGCAAVCESEIDGEVPVSDVMRYLMYARCYGELETAISYFNDIPLNVRNRIAHIDYRKAERKCPRGLDIGRLMREATLELG